MVMDPYNYRNDFPLCREGQKEKLIYFDNACMTLRPQQVIDRLVEYYTFHPGCGGRSLHRISSWVTENYEGARDTIAEFLKAPDRDGVIFTKNATEAINLVSHSFRFNRGDRVLGTDHEHNSNLVPWVQLMNKGVIRYEPVPSMDDNTFDIEKFKEMIPGTRLVSMVHVSNLDGTRIPEKEIVEISHDSGAIVMLDCAQSVPHLKMDMKGLDLDLMVFSGHKAMGPTGTGVLAGKPELINDLDPFIVGGDTVHETGYDRVEFLDPPKKFEAGLQHYSGFIALGTALEYLERVGMDDLHEHELILNRYATSKMKDMVRIMGPSRPEDRGGILPFQVRGLNPHDVAMMLDEIAGVEVRSGKHCVHSWFKGKGEDPSVRASFYLYNTKQEVDVLVDTLSTIIEDFT
ncbi:MAG: cysteine desulfurase [Candidatus Thermoplasmatota archaeon]|nr:cysteine desulfurase [Candidatus Thermoplasmatota archaeon]